MGLDPEKICVAPEIRYKLEIQDKQDLLNFCQNLEVATNDLKLMNNIIKELIEKKVISYMLRNT